MKPESKKKFKKLGYRYSVRDNVICMKPESKKKFKKLEYRKDIDGLCAIAVLSVIV